MVIFAVEFLCLQDGSKKDPLGKMCYHSTRFIVVGLWLHDWRLQCGDEATGKG
jgi:hypothetical protein